jgi:hypothetical protein
MVDNKVSSRTGIGGSSTTAKPATIGESPELAFRSISQQIRGLALNGFSLDQPLARATALGGKADIEGPRARDVANALNFLYARSRKFRRWVDDDEESGSGSDEEPDDSQAGPRKRRRKKKNRYIVRTTFGDIDSFASIGQDEETVLLNLDQIKGTKYGLVGLVAHEFGHAAGGYKDGEPGKVGPNQIAQAEVLTEAGVGDGGVLPYGQDLGGRGIKPAYYIMMA